ncbi:MAG: hypothetical protein BWZ09_02713 [Alphaproteobacteria bacterium ADurb.BinA305]|nr:MAG: hypothetical protein BWZ09_02713 [Alphaproteobacteria bacterium ADurb.BinA305]
MTRKEFKAEIRDRLNRARAYYERELAAEEGRAEVKMHWRKAHAVRAYRVRGCWVRRIGPVTP